MKTPQEMLREAGMLEAAQEMRQVFGAKLVAIRDREGNGYGRVELLEGAEPNNFQIVAEKWRGKR